jgi:hypothetical protein
LLKVSELGLALTVPLLAATPVPETAMLSGEYSALLYTETQPLTAPELAGLKVTLASKLLEGARVRGRGGVETAKSVLSTEIELMVAFTAPVLVTVSAFAPEVTPTVSLPKPREDGLTEIWGVALVAPFPERARLSGEAEVLLEIESQPLSELVVEGVNLTLI